MPARIFTTMKNAMGGVLFLFLLLPGMILAAAQPKNVAIAEYVTTETLCEALQSPRINDNVIKAHGYSVARLKEIIADCYAAGQVSPSLGHTGLAALRWISICYCESGLHPYRSHTNSNGTVDIGIAQVNSVHWNCPPSCTTWFQFCDYYALPHDLGQLFQPKVNLLFAAWVQELLYSQGKRTYQYAKLSRPDQRFLYRFLYKQVRARLRALAIDPDTLEDSRF